ncbi:carboxylesterase [Aspergillus homomorphus CBS 101889]|uniref:Carboxylic ester hydrolase n=1 Tax=Aspergillus homomorphus (strain CBS 101889) TaxID=1450537 RepID=A0A395HY17_ASPHC|nr:carboxylesterase [Aspergillus homomorphus CBS 101889]RAL12687.1 carboxylesterase [Aspergillus homomorphus CBS 101889]
MFARSIRTAAALIALLGTRTSASPISPGLTLGEGLLVQTSSGPVQGFINLTTPDVRQFLGVPFAEPPIGELRFAKPVEKKPNGMVNAFALPPSCIQQTSNSSSIYTAYEKGFLISGGDSEDCLYLSIWAPKVESIRSQERPLPVLLYVPGGGFTSGGQASMYKIPDHWIQRSQSHIVVIMNYRVNVFGFPNAEGLQDQNPGLLDQRTAVEWVHANIANFGGDPDRITLWGQSAGGGSVSLYTYSYPDDPIVAAVAADSGAPGIVSFQDYAHTNFTFLAGLVGCGGLNSSSAELSCVRGVPAKTIQNALSTYSGTPSISFKPSVDNVTVFANWTQRALEGKVAKIPMIIGSNANEGAGFVSFTPNGPGAATLFKLTESIIACPVAHEVKNRNLAGLPTYRYQYAGNFTNISPLPWFGAYHSSELPILFGTHNQYGGPSTQFEWEVSYAMEALWLSFAEDPSRGPVRLTVESAALNPNNSSYFAWPEFQQGSSNLVVFAENDVLMQLVTSDRIDDHCSGL